MRRNASSVVPSSLKALSMALAGIAMVTGVSTAAAMDDSVDGLLEKLKSRGVLTEQEYEEMKTERDAQKMEARAERRKRAMREAIEVEKEEKAKEDAKTTLVGRFRDGFSFESGDKKNSIALSGRVHGDYRHFSVNSTNANTANTFDVRRAYIGVSGKIANDFTFDVTADVAQTAAPQLDVAWANIQISPAAQFRIGQFKMPMSIEELTSSRFIDFQERSFVNAQVPAKERGAMIHGTPYPGVFYGLAVSNGAGKNNNESSSTVDNKDVIGRVGLNLAEITGNKDLVLHAAIAYSDGEIPSTSSVSLRTEGRGLTFFNPTITSSSGSIDRTRKHWEASLAFGRFKFQTEQMYASYSGVASGTHFEREVDLRYLEALWMITGEQYADAYRGGAYGAIKPLRPFAMGSGNPGAWELGVRLSEADATEFAAVSGQTREARGVTVGVKWIPVTNVRMYLNVTRTSFDTPVTVVGGTTTGETAVTFRTGLYF